MTSVFFTLTVNPNVLQGSGIDQRVVEHHVECEQGVFSHRHIEDRELELEWFLYVFGAVAG